MNIVIYGLTNSGDIKSKGTTCIRIDKPNYLYPINTVHSISVSSLKNNYPYCGFKVEIEYSSYNKMCYSFSAYIELENKMIDDFTKIHVTHLAINRITDASIYIKLTFGVTIIS